MMSKIVTRRAFLRVAAAGVAGAVLAACQPKIVEVTTIVEKEKVVKETVVVAGRVQGRREGRQRDGGRRERGQSRQPVGKDRARDPQLPGPWAKSPLTPPPASSAMPTPAFEVQVQTDFEGWDTKVIAQQNDGTLEWSAAGILTPSSI